MSMTRRQDLNPGGASLPILRLWETLGFSTTMLSIALDLEVSRSEARMLDTVF